MDGPRGYYTKVKLVRQRMTSVGEDVEKREPSPSCCGNVVGAATMESNMEVPQNV